MDKYSVSFFDSRCIVKIVKEYCNVMQPLAIALDMLPAGGE